MAIPSSGPISLTDVQTEFGGSNPISLSEYYAGGAYVAAGTTGTYGAVPSSGAISLRNFYGTNAVVIGQQAYTSAGTYTWVAPSGVTSVSVVAVGGGGWPRRYCCGGVMKGGGGGGLGYKNNYTVTPGSSYTVVVGAGGRCGVSNCGGTSYFVDASTVVSGRGANQGNENYNFQGYKGGTFTGTGGGNGGDGAIGGTGSGGGGAGGYSGNGGCGRSTNSSNGNNGQACSGAAGGGWGGAGGGGVGILGKGATGTGGAGQSYFTCNGAGGGGSGGATGGQFVNLCYALQGGYGGAYGGGAGQYNCRRGCFGGSGAVRIIWPGTTRSFPSTGTGNL